MTLNHRQGKFIDKIAARLGSGPLLSDADGVVLQATLRALGLDV